MESSTEKDSRPSPQAQCRWSLPQVSVERRGFSLPEMLIVIAILAAMAAFTAPAMRGPLDKSRLRSSATSVKAAIAKARATAIRRGAEVLFLYQLNGDRWKIEASKSKFAPSTATPLNQGLPEISTPSNAREVIQQGQLPNGCLFTDHGVVDSGDAEMLGEESPPAETGLLEESAVPPERWADPVVFRPHGRGQDGQIVIRGNRDFAVTVDVRGLTGNVSYSSPFRLPGSQTSPVSDEMVN